MIYFPDNNHRSWHFNGKSYHGCMDSRKVSPNVTFYLTNDVCKTFYQQNPLFWGNEKLDLNQSFHGPQILQIEIFSDKDYHNMNARRKGIVDHLATCFNPKILKPHLGSEKNIKWCLTSTSYREILEEKHLQSPRDIGICPGVSKVVFELS